MQHQSFGFSGFGWPVFGGGGGGSPPAPRPPIALTVPTIIPAIATVGVPVTITNGTYQGATSVIRVLMLNGRDVTGQVSPEGVYIPTETGALLWVETARNASGVIGQSAEGMAGAIDFEARYQAQSLGVLGAADAAAWGGAGFTMRGQRGLVWTVAGTGAAITADAAGFTFDKAQYFACSPAASPAYERIMVLVDATITATGGSVAQVNGAIASKLFLNISGNGDLAGQGPNNVNVAIGARVAEIGERRCVAFILDRTGRVTEGRVMMQINPDGFVTYGDATAPIANIPLSNMRIGSGGRCKIHRMAFFGAGAGQDFAASPIQLWQDFASRILPSYSDEFEVWATTGHSLNAFRTAETGLANSTWTRQDREGVKIVGGLVNLIAQPITVAGAGWGVINTSVSSSGLQPAEIAGDVTNMFAAAVARCKIATDRGQTPARIIAMSSHAAGAEAGQLDLSTSTGVDTSVVIYNNAAYQASEAGRLLAGKNVVRRVNSLSIGTSDRTDAPGVYAAEIKRALDQHRDLQAAQWPAARLHEIIYQSPGSKNTSVVTDYWERVIMAEYAEAEARGAHLIPLYPYGADGQNDHPHAIQGTLYGEVAAWAVDWAEQGRRWTIAQPTITRDGGRFTLSYPSLNADEAFEFTPDSWYANPPANKGFEVLGGAITGVSLDGNRIILDTTGAVTTLRFANQRANVVGQVHFGFRGLVRTNARRACIRFPDRQLYRHLPSFQIEVPA